MSSFERKLSYALIVECMTRCRLNRTPFLLNPFLSYPSDTACRGCPPRSPCWLELLLPSRVFSCMRIREENCNMVLLAVVASFSVAIAGGATLLGFADNKPVRLADRTTDRVEQAPTTRQANYPRQRPTGGPRDRRTICPEHESPRTLASASPRLPNSKSP